jgi:hypothetical protein
MLLFVGPSLLTFSMVSKNGVGPAAAALTVGLGLGLLINAALRRLG